MAIEYPIGLDIDFTPDKLARWIVQHCSMDYGGIIPDHEFWIMKHPRVETNGVVCTVAYELNSTRKITKEEYDLNTEIDVTCRIDKFDYFEEGMNNFVALCLKFLENFSCDLIVKGHQGSEMLLLRKKGIITVNCQDSYWEEVWYDAFATTKMQFVPYQPGAPPKD